MAYDLILIAGKDPLEGRGGHSVYVRMWAHAARRAGFAPHLFCVSHGRGKIDTDYATVHRIHSPLSWLPNRHMTGFRTHMIVWHMGLLAKAIASFARARKRPCLLHGIGPWSTVTPRAKLLLYRSRIPCRMVMTSYTTLAHEYIAKHHGVTRTHGILPRFRMSWEMLCLRLILDRAEKRAYRQSDMVLVNYESVRRILERQWGRGPRIRKVPYTTEGAMLTGRVPLSSRGPMAAISRLGPPESPLVVSVSRHDPRKGLDVLIRALGRLKDRRVRFRA